MSTGNLRTVKCDMCEQTVVCDILPFTWRIAIERVKGEPKTKKKAAVKEQLVTRFLCPEHAENA
jgi:hypothetical protein